MYNVRRWLVPLNYQIFRNSLRGLDNSDFYFPKIFKFFIKRVTGRLFDYYGIVPKHEKKEVLVHSKLEGIICCINFFVKRNLQRQDFSKFTGD